MHHLVALGLSALQACVPGIITLRRLAKYDRPGADDQELFAIVIAAWHLLQTPALQVERTAKRERKWTFQKLQEDEVRATG